MANKTLAKRRDQRNDRARRAVTEFRKLQPTLTAYARNLTGKRDVGVEMSVKSNGHTDGKKIFMKPPIALGDASLMRHDRFLCDKRDPETLEQQCPACRTRERVLAVIYHEIAHIAFDSFLPTTRTDADMTLKMIQSIFPAWYYDQLKRKFDRNPDILYGKKDYAILAQMVNPYFAFLVNALEDVRINERMADARPGTRVMQTALLLDAAINGVEQKDKDTGANVWIRWSEYPTNHQITLAAMCIAAGIQIQPDWFEERVYEDAQDADLKALLTRVHKLPGPGAVYQHCFPVYMRLRELGYFRLKDEEPEPQPEEKPGDGEVPDDSPESSDDGSGGEDLSDGPDAPGSDSDSGAGEEDSGSDPASDGEGSDSGDAGEDGGADDTGREPGSAERGAGGPDDADAGDSGGGTSDGGTGESGAPGSAEPGDHGMGAEDHRDDGRGDQDGRRDDQRDGQSDRRGDEADAAGAAGSGEPSADPAMDGGEGQADGADSPGDRGSGEVDHEPDSAERAGAGPSTGGVEPDSGDQSPDGQDGTESGTDRGAEEGLDERLESDNDRGTPAGASADEVPAAERLPDQDAAGSAEADPASAGDAEPSDSEAEEPGLQSEDGDAEGERADDPDAGSDGGGFESGESDRGNGEQSATGGDDSGVSQGEPSEPGSGVEVPGLGTGDDDADLSEPEDWDGDERTAPSEDRAIDEDDEALDYKPEQAFDATDKELKRPPVEPTITSDENLTLIDLGMHPEVDEGEDAGEVMEKAVESAIIQSIYFEMPSQNIPGLKVWKYDDRFEDCVLRPWHAWNGERYSDRAASRRGQIIDPVGEQWLGPALMRMRVVFSDNLRAKRNRNQRSGRIDTRTLGKRGWSGDDRLFGKKVLPGKKDYFVSIFLDISGSTVGVNIKMIKEAALAQAELCHRMGINFAVYGHTGSWVDSTEIYGDPWVDLYEVKAPDQPWDDKSRSALMELNPSMANLDGHTLEFARKLCDQQPQTNKVILYYSDGAMPLENHDEELEILQREIATCKAKGYTLLGVGVRTDSPSRHGLDTVQIDSSEEVGKVVSHLERNLVA